MSNSDVELVTAMYETFYATFLVDRNRNVAFGPLIYGKTPIQSFEKAVDFITHLRNRFPYINIATINTERLIIYYKEFLDEISPGN